MTELFRMAHIAAGVVALSAFWVPMVARKGGVVHRRAGWTYAIAMWAAAVSAWVVCAARLTDEKTSNDPAAIFLAFVGLLAANGAATGIRAVRTRRRAEASRNPLDIGIAGVLVLASVALAIRGVNPVAPLFLAFGALGAILGLQQLGYWLRPPPSPKEYWFVHMGNMLAACIGTVTAFLVVNTGRLGLQDYALFVWIAPGVVGGFGIAFWQRYYRAQVT